MFCSSIWSGKVSFCLFASLCVPFSFSMLTPVLYWQFQTEIAEPARSSLIPHSQVSTIPCKQAAVTELLLVVSSTQENEETVSGLLQVPSQIKNSGQHSPGFCLHMILWCFQSMEILIFAQAPASFFCLLVFSFQFPHNCYEFVNTGSTSEQFASDCQLVFPETKQLSKIFWLYFGIAIKH